MIYGNLKVRNLRDIFSPLRYYLYIDKDMKVFMYTYRARSSEKVVTKVNEDYDQLVSYNKRELNHIKLFTAS